MKSDDKPRVVTIILSQLT